jgi:hypothetical protein
MSTEIGWHNIEGPTVMDEPAQQQQVSSRITWFDSMKNRSFFAFLCGARLRIPKAF